MDTIDTEPHFRLLRDEFTSKGMHYRQVYREGDLAIYKQTRIGSAKPELSTTWEVIRIRRHKGYSIKGNRFPPAEMYPHSKQWGNLGWTLKSLEEAEKKFAWAKTHFATEENLPEDDLETNDETNAELPQTVLEKLKVIKPRTIQASDLRPPETKTGQMSLPLSSPT